MTIPNSRPPTSIGVSRKRPATNPTETPTTTATIIAKNVSSSVAAPFTAMMSRTGAAVGDRRAEVAATDGPEVVAVLGEERLVVAEPVLDLLDLGRRHVSPERSRDRIARRHPHEQEHRASAG